MTRILAIAVALLLMAPAAALAKKTDDISFTSTGKAAAPGAAAGTGADGTFEDIPFTIAPDDQDGAVSVEVHWSNPADDFDLYVYKRNSAGELDQVGSSAGAPPATSESTVIQSQGSSPVEPGEYVVRVQNYAASSPDFEGVIKFADFTLPNTKPKAALKARKKARAGKRVKLDASGSSDPDGTIVNFAWDLDGDGSIETDGGGSSVLRPTFSPGIHHVTVRVTDDKGARAYKTRRIRVRERRGKKK